MPHPTAQINSPKGKDAGWRPQVVLGTGAVASEAVHCGVHKTMQVSSQINALTCTYDLAHVKKQVKSSKQAAGKKKKLSLCPASSPQYTCVGSM